jgi:hypothetical protein
MDSVFVDLDGNSTFVLSRVDFLEGCFLDKIGLGGSSGRPEVETEGLAADAEADMDPDLSFLSSLAGVLTAETGGVVDSFMSIAEDESRLERSSLCDKSCRYSSSSCRLRSSYNPSS